jgi:hypothetical protein
MSKAKYNIKIEVPYELTSEHKAEFLAEIRSALQVLKRTNPNLSLMVTREFGNEELMEALRGAQQELKDDTQSREHCSYYEEAQGRHYCHNDLVKARNCRGVCKNYKPK